MRKYIQERLSGCIFRFVQVSGLGPAICWMCSMAVAHTPAAGLLPDFRFGLAILAGFIFAIYVALPQVHGVVAFSALLNEKCSATHRPF